MRYVLTLLLALLLISHQDYWNWDQARLWWGFLPQGLAWHLLVSLAAAGTWWLAASRCWPHELVEQTEAEVESTR